MGKQSSDKLHIAFLKHLEIAKNKMLNADIREESRQLAQFLAELIAYRAFLEKTKKERSKDERVSKKSPKRSS